jgi:hypothetical protein
MFREPELNIPIDKVATALGLRLGKARDMYYAPQRNEKEASLHLDRGKNVWYDHGTGKGGTVADLVMLTRNCSRREAYEFLRSVDLSAAQEHNARSVNNVTHITAPGLIKTTDPDKSIEIRRVRPIECYYLTKYIAGRKIPAELAKAYCKEVTTYSHLKKMTFTHIGFQNNSGGWALSSPTGFKSTTKADITTINKEGEISKEPSSKSVALFEGFFDFLSWQVMQSSKTPSCDVVVLNSVNNLQRAREYIQAHEKATCFLDNDAAGEKCYQGVRDMMKGKEVLDMSDLYGEHKDLNAFLQASPGYTSDMKLTLHM